jgi:hypothetical protein
MTIFPYLPQPNTAYRFDPTLDGQQYTAVVPWGLFGRRLYLSLYDQNAIRIFTRALIGSPDASPVQKTVWSGGVVTLTFLDSNLDIHRHGYKPLSTFDLTVSGFLPEEYNGRFLAFIPSVNTISYSLPSDPGAPTRLGAVSYDVNLVSGYFTTSTMVFRESSQQFEVAP